jgi:GT2 family glycosyltransferase
MPSLSVIIPVRNGGADFERVLRGLRAFSPTDLELVVVDDGSQDDSAAIAARHGALVIRHDRPLGPAASRNAGARAASAPLLFFLDADVLVHPDTITRLLAHFAANPDLTALFGSYDDTPAAPGLVSQFRNLLHHYVHQSGHFVTDARPAHTFWTGCGAIRRDTFLALGGFDPRLYRQPAIEDIELGYRLTRAGYRIALARDVQVTHLKRWTFTSMVRTDLLHRGIPWMLLILRTHIRETDLNVSPIQRASVLAIGLALLAAMASPFTSQTVPAVFACLILAILLNAPFYHFLATRRGPGFALASIPLHWTYFICCGISVIAACILQLVLPEPSVHSAHPRVPPPKSLLRSRRRWTRNR